MRQQTLFSTLLSLALLLNFWGFGAKPPSQVSDEKKANAASSAPPQQLSQVNQRTNGSTLIYDTMEFGNAVVYIVVNSMGQNVLWISDGTPEGSRVLQTGFPGYFDDTTDLKLVSVVHQGVLYFGFQPGDDQVNLWRTDGTTAGTRELKQWSISSDWPVPTPISLAANDKGVFAVVDDQLWKVDGSSLLNYAGFSVSRPPVAYRGLAYFLGSRTVSENTYTGGLWTTDGTLENTHLAVDRQDLSINLTRLTVVKDELLYLISEGNEDSGTPSGLGVTDGTLSGTKFLNDLPALQGQVVSDVQLNGDRLILLTRDAQGRSALWETTGMSEAGSFAAPGKRVDLYSPEQSRNPIFEPVGRVGNVFYYTTRFSALSGDYTLWALPDSGASVRIGVNRAGGYLKRRSMAVLGAQLYFTGFDNEHGSEIFVTAGTLATTHAAFDLAEGVQGSNPGRIARCGARVCFPADDRVHGMEMWSSAGDSATLLLLKDANIDAPSSGGPYNPVKMKSLTYFAANVGSNIRELWRTDGTPQGTYAIQSNLARGSESYHTQIFLPVGSRLFFQVGQWFETATPDQYELWVTQGTPESTYPMADSFPQDKGYQPIPLAAVGSQLAVTTQDQNGYEKYLWLVSANNEVRLIHSLSGVSEPFLPFAFPLQTGFVFFTGSSSHFEAWYSDGTSENTRSIGSFSGGAMVQGASIGGQVYFSSWTRLWRTDGTAAGTEELTIPTDLNNPSVGSIIIYKYIPSGQKLFFLTAESDNRPGAEHAGYQKLYSVQSGAVAPILVHAFPDYGRFYWQAPLNGGLAFAGGGTWVNNSQGGYDYHTTLWVSDGTSEGTHSVMEGPGGIATLLSVGSALYFPHFDLPPTGGASEATMWKWDSAGTGAPAQLEALAPISVFTVAEGEESSIFLPDLAAFKGALLVIGKEGTGGKELWAYPIPESTDDPQEDSHFLYLPLVIRVK